MIHLIQQILALCLLSLRTLIRRQGGFAALVMGLVGSLAHGGAFAANDAAFTTQTALANMTVGESYTFSVTMKNVGTTSWTTTGGYALVLQNSSGWSLSSIANTVAVAVNGSRAFSGTISPPSTPGVYTFQWCMAQSGAVFGACSTPLTIQVAARAPDATFSSQTTFTTQTTTTRTISVTMKNTGNTTWKQAQVFLGTQNPQDNMIWGINRLKLSTATVAPNASGTFTGTITAPVSGYYDLQWQALEEGKGYFGDLTPNQNIAVAGGVPVLNIVSPGKDMALINNGGVDIPVRASSTAMGIATITNIVLYQKDVDGVHFNSLAADGPEMDILYHRSASASTKTLDFYMQTTDSFGKKSPEAHVVVNVLNDNSTLVSTTLPAAMVPGLPYEFDVVLKNTGDLPWNPQTVTYGPSTDAYAVIWGNLTVPLTSPVAVGESATFHVKVTAPATEGSYFYSGRLKESTRAPFGAIAGKTVTVARQPPVVSMAAPTTALALDVPTRTTGTVRIQGGAQPGTAASVSKIDVLDGAAVIATVYADTIDQDLSLAVGTHSLKLRATDNWNETGLSAIATVTVKGNDAAFYSQTVPAKMEVGKAYSATVTMRNSGNKPWTAATGYALGSQNPTNNTIWRDSRVSPTSTISAGGALTLSLPLVAPTVPGKYNFQWQMLQDGVEWFGDLTPNVEVTVNPVAPAVGALTLPLAGDKFIAIGGKGLVRVQGTVPASAGASVSKLEVLDGTTVVATSDSGTVDTVVQLVAGAHTLKLRATDNFGQVVTGTATTAITVLSNSATAVSRTADASMAGGTEYQVTVVMHNAGTAAWSPDDGYALGPVPDDPTWVSAYIPVPGVIAPGANATFTFTVRAPGNPGVYPFQWQMLRQYQDGTPVEWFGAKSTIQSISVTGAAPTVSLQRPVDGVSYAITGGTGTTFSVPIAAVAIADSPATISKMEVLDGATVKYTLNNSSQLNVNLAFSPGAHAVQVRATDNVGKIGLSDIAKVTISVPPPTATISAPLAGATVVAAASGQASVAVRGTATVLNGATIAAVDLMEGDTVLQTGKVAAVSMTQAFAPGVHSIKLRVTDSTGQKTDSAAVQFTVYQQVTGNAAMFIGQTVPSVMRTAQPYSVTVNMLNTGSTTWTEATQFRLGSFNPQDNRIWTSTGRAYLAASVAPGATAKFTVPVTAPQKAGLYNFQWRMVQDGTGWFGDMTENLPITVADGAGPALTLKVTPTNVRMVGTTPVTLSFSAIANEAGRKITRLDVLVDKGSGYAATAVKSATGSSATLALDFTTTATAGVYKYKARATDDLGVQTDTDNVVVNIADSTVLGNISGVRIDRDNKPVLVGWLCQPGASTALAYEVLLDAPTPAAGGTQLTTGVANVSGEPDDASVQSACGTPGISHSFKVDLSGTSSGGARKMAMRSLAAEATAADTPDTNTYAGRALYVHALNLGTAPVVLPCDDNSCTMPGSMRIALATPSDGTTLKGPSTLFVRTVISGTSAPLDEVAIAVDGNWQIAQQDTALGAYFANFPDLQPRKAAYSVQSRVRQGNSTLYSAVRTVTVEATETLTLTLTSPSTATILGIGNALSLSAVVSGSATPQSVKFYANGQVVSSGSRRDNTWTASWMPELSSTYSIEARAFDSSDVLLATSSTSSVIVTASADDAKPIPVALDLPHLSNSIGGTLPGKLAVGNDGAATYSIDLPVPPGTAGMQPKLSLEYSSLGSNGPLGLGWTLSGLSTIQRCAKSIAQDGVSGRISFGQSDRLCMDGQRLVLANLPTTDVNYWAANAEYRTEVRGFDRITRLANQGFKLEAKDGRVSYYGTSTASAMSAPGRPDGQVVSWALDRVEDRKGNFQTVNYIYDGITGEFLPKQIRYGGNTVASTLADLAVQFEYEKRPDEQVRYVGGPRSDLHYRLINVKSFVNTAADGSGGQSARNLTLHYTESVATGRSQVDWMQICAFNTLNKIDECLPKTTFNWGQSSAPHWTQLPIAPFYLPSLGSAQTDSSYSYEANFDGSGKTSFFSTNQTGTNPQPGLMRVRLPDGREFDRKIDLSGLSYPNMNQVLVGDLDGDGRDDLFVNIAVGSAIVPGGEYCLTVPSADGTIDFDCHPMPSSAKVDTMVDLHNDKRMHLVASLSTASMTDCYLQNGVMQCDEVPMAGDVPPVNPAHVDGSSPDPHGISRVIATPVNLSKEGGADFYRLYGAIESNNFVGRANVCFNQTQGMICQNIYSVGRNGNAGPYFSSISNVGDFNNDGIADMIYSVQTYGADRMLPVGSAQVVATDRTVSRVVCLGTESSADCRTDDGFAPYAFVPGDLRSATDKQTDFDRVKVGDFTGDGVIRQLFGVKPTPPGTDGAKSVMCRYGYNGSVCQEFDYSRVFSDEVKQVYLDGSGVPAFVFRTDLNQLLWTAFTLKAPAEEDKLVSVINGMGLREEVTYARGDDADVYSRFTLIDGKERRPVYPQVAISPGTLVKELRRDNGHGGWMRYQYRFEGKLSDASGRGELGFGKMQVVDMQTGFRTVSLYNQDYPFVGMVSSTTTSTTEVSPGAPTTSVNISSIQNRFGRKDIPLGNGAYTVFPFIAGTTEKLADLDGSFRGSSETTGSASQSDVQYDDWGNLLSRRLTSRGTWESSDASFTSDTVNSYYPADTTNWQNGLVQKTILTKKQNMGETSPIVRSTAFTYEPDASGQILTVTSEPDDVKLRVTTTFDRSANKFGLVNGKTLTWRDPVSNVDVERRETTTYDGQGRFVDRHVNAMNLTETFDYDRATGVMVKRIDPNQLETRWNVDGFGRLISEVSSDGRQISHYVRACNGDCPAHGVLAQIIDTTFGPSRISVPSIKYSDAAGHVVQTSTWGFDGKIIVVEQRYDESGRLYEIDRPRYIDDNAYLDHRRQYDALDRVTKMTTIDDFGIAHVATTTYAGMMVETTNANQYSRTDYFDALGRILQTKDAKGKQTKFSYDAFGNRLSSTDPLQHVVVVTYDNAGHRITMDDPDLGFIQYGVDPVGQVLSISTPQQRATLKPVTTFKFDGLGRMIERAEPDLLSRWVYDRQIDGEACNTTHSCGKLVEAYTYTESLGQKDYQRLHAFDRYGRPMSTTHRLYDAIYSETNVYDDWGRITTRTAQRGQEGAIKAYGLRYNAFGYLERIQRGSQILWQALEGDAAQQMTKVSLGNGLHQARTYGPYTGMISNADLLNAKMEIRLQEEYRYDPMGNVLSRSQYWDTHGYQESFTYDELNRLKTSDVLGKSNLLTFTYDDAGGILSKSGVGTVSGEDPKYHYPEIGKPGPAHGVDFIPTIGKFAYDANGNMISGAGRLLEWSSFDMPTLISRAGSNGLVSSRFVYGPEHQRTRQIRQDGSQIIYAGMQEVELDSNNSLLSVKTYWPQGTGVEIDKANGLNDQYWIHVDRLGSPVALSGVDGSLKDYLAYDAWGKRRTLDGDVISGTATPDAIRGGIDNKGFTGHEMLDGLDLVHMNGRVYDPLTGRVLSGDPEVQDPNNGQSLNRYSYVFNNPTNRVDPSGFYGVDAVKGEVEKQFIPGRRLASEQTIDAAAQAARTSQQGGRVQNSIDGRVPTQQPGAARDSRKVADKGFSLEGYLTETGRKLLDDFVKNNLDSEYKDRLQFTWLAQQLEGTYEKPDSESINGMAASATAIGATLLTPGGAEVNAVKEVEAAKALTHSKEFSGALSKAMAWLEEKGFKAEKQTQGKFENLGKPVGMQTADGKIGFRVEYDERNGAHINVWAGKEKGPHYTFDVSKETVEKIHRLFN